MQTNATKAPKGKWLLMAAISLLIYLFLMGWGDFKEGFLEGYRQQMKAKP